MVYNTELTETKLPPYKLPIGQSREVSNEPLHAGPLATQGP
jgi:hypothetical protein